MADRIHHKCPACDKVSYFQEGQPLICKQCGHVVEEEQVVSQATAMGLGGLGLAALALLFMPFLPLAFLLCAGAVTLGIMAIVQHEEGDATPVVLGAIAIMAGLAGALLIWLLWTLDFSYAGGSSDTGTGPEGGSGGTGGGTGGSGGGGGGGGGVGTPFPGTAFIATSLLLAVQMKRRHG